MDPLPRRAFGAPEDAGDFCDRQVEVVVQRQHEQMLRRQAVERLIESDAVSR